MAMIDDAWAERASHVQQLCCADTEREYRMAAMHALARRMWYPEGVSWPHKSIAVQTRWNVAELLLRRFSEDGDCDRQIDLLAIIVAMKNYARRILAGTLHPDHHLKNADTIFFPAFLQRIEQEWKETSRMQERWSLLRNRILQDPGRYGHTVDDLYEDAGKALPTVFHNDPRLRAHMRHSADGRCRWKNVTVVSREEMMLLQRQIHEEGIHPQEMILKMLEDETTKMIVVFPHYKKQFQAFTQRHLPAFMAAGLTHFLITQDMRCNDTEGGGYVLRSKAQPSCAVPFRYVAAGLHYDYGGPTALDLEVSTLEKIVQGPNAKALYLFENDYYPAFWPFKDHQRSCDELSITEFMLSVPRMVEQRLGWEIGSVKTIDIVGIDQMENWVDNSDICNDTSHLPEPHDIRIRKAVAFDPSETVLMDKRHDYRFPTTFGEAFDAVIVAPYTDDDDGGDEEPLDVGSTEDDNEEPAPPPSHGGARRQFRIRGIRMVPS